jgi:uncharacterized phage protein (TIGR02218 family)
VSRDIPIALQSHLEGSATTLCMLLKIVCRNGTTFGFTSSDKDRDYDDGDGLITYKAPTGFEMSEVSASSDLGVDNAEGSGLIPIYDLPEYITEQDVQAGLLDYAEQWVYLVNYRDLDTSDSPYRAKHAELFSGTVGRNKISFGQVLQLELLSLSNQMRQNFVQKTSVRCRNDFGDEFCGVDVEALWQEFEVVAVGAESDRTFTIDGPSVSSPPAADHAFQPGLVEWTYGDNTGTHPEVEDNLGAVVTLATPTRYPVQAGDRGRIRRDCKKRFVEDCIGENDNGLNFNGEPNLPLADDEQLGVPNGAR